MRIAAAAALSFGLVVGAANGPAAGGSSADSHSKLIAAGKLTLAGRSMRCGSLPTLMSTTFWDFGGAERGRIILNPTKLNSLPPTIQLYIYSHECGHQMRGQSETAADCYAVQQGRRDGWLERDDLDDICGFFHDHPSTDSVHPPGPERCTAMIRCFDKAKPRSAGK